MAEITKKKEVVKEISKKECTVRINITIGTKKPKVLKVGDKILLTDNEVRNYKQNNII